MPLKRPQFTEVKLSTFWNDESVRCDGRNGSLRWSKGSGEFFSETGSLKSRWLDVFDLAQAGNRDYFRSMTYGGHKSDDPERAQQSTRMDPPVAPL